MSYSIEAKNLIERFYDEDAQSQYQIDCFVLAQNGITTWGQFKQCLREISVRLGLIESEEHRLASIWKRWRLGALEVRRTRSRIFRSQVELARLLQRSKAFLSLLGGEASLDAERISQLDRDYFIAKIKFFALTELASCRALSSGTIQTIYSMPPDDRLDVLQLLQKVRDNPEEALNSLPGGSGASVLCSGSVLGALACLRKNRADNPKPID